MLTSYDLMFSPFSSGWYPMCREREDAGEQLFLRYDVLTATVMIYDA